MDKISSSASLWVNVSMYLRIDHYFQKNKLWSCVHNVDWIFLTTLNSYQRNNSAALPCSVGPKIGKGYIIQFASSRGMCQADHYELFANLIIRNWLLPGLATGTSRFPVQHVPHLSNKSHGEKLVCQTTSPLFISQPGMSPSRSAP